MARAEITDAMIRRAKAGEHAAISAIVLAMEPQAKAVAVWFVRHYRDAALDLDDLIQEGRISVLRSISGWDFARGEAQFPTYAYESILNANRKYAGRERRRSQVEYRQTDVEARRDSDGEVANFSMAAVPDRAPPAVGRISPVGGLDPDGAAVVAMRLEPLLAGHSSPSWRTIARRLGLSADRVRDLYDEAMTTIRAAHRATDDDT
jgi:RNA polymerase sigma factor (sigma-70 family)